MIVVAIALSVLALALLVGGLIAAAYASVSGRYRLVTVSAAVVALWLFWALLGGPQAMPHPVLLVLAGVLLAAIGIVAGNPLAVLVLSLATRDSVPGAHGGIIVDTAADGGHVAREVLRGGMTIGYLERLAIVGCIMAGQFAGVAVVVAIKGLGRFSELENAEARERFIIGTLVSFIWAVLCAAPIALALAY